MARAFGVFVERDEFFFDLMMMQEPCAFAWLFADHRARFAQDTQRAQRDVVRIADGVETR